jgi:hypothetical protein
MSRWQSRIVEIVGGIVRHAELLHDPARPPVRWSVNNQIAPLDLKGEALCQFVLSSWHSAHEKESENKPAPALKSQLWNCVNLPLQLDLDDLETLFCLVLRQVSKGVHVLHRSGFRVDVLRFAIRVGELGAGVR